MRGKYFSSVALCCWLIAALLLNGDFCSAGEEGCSLFSDTTFVRAIALSVDQYGHVFVLDGGTSQILKLSATGEEIARSGGYGWTELSLDQPSDVITINGFDIFVADYGNHRIQRFDQSLSLLSSLPTGSEVDNKIFGYPRSVAVGVSGALYIVDGENNRIVKIDIDGSQRSFGDIHEAKGRLHSPSRVRISSNELVFVQDSNAIVTFDRFGNYVRTFGNQLFHSLTSFNIDRDTIYALDSGRMLKINERGTLIASNDDVCSSLRATPMRFIDVAMRDGKCYFLTEHSLYTIDSEEIFNPGNRKLKQQ